MKTHREETNPEPVVITSSSSGSVTKFSSYSPSIRNSYVPKVNSNVEVELADSEITEQEVISEPIEIEVTISSFEETVIEPVIRTQKIKELKTKFLEIVKRIRMLLVGL